MAWTPEALEALLSDLRRRGTDFPDVEVKSAAGGTPSLGETLCAFGNMPNGGTIILGLDERAGFRPVGLTNPAEIEQGIASQARGQVTPPVQVRFDQAEVDGAIVVIATVSPVSAVYRPCRFHGKAYLRQADGDYVMSEQEVQQILAQRGHSRHDGDRVEGTSIEDLDPDMLTRYLRSARSGSRRLADVSDDAVLRRTSILTPDGPELTVAGLYALGAYPQQFMPNLSITAAVNLDPRSGSRTHDLVHLDGPIPALLEDAMHWVRRNTQTTIRFGADGHGRDAVEIPMVAVRELVANALVHRDIGPHTQSRRVEIRLTNDQLVITSPGGLYGVSVQQLGAGGKSAVNEYLYDICKRVETTSGARVIEGEGGGIAEVIQTLKLANMRSPHFVDKGVSFTVLLPRHSLLATSDLEWLQGHALLPLDDVQKQVAVSMRHGQVWTNVKVREEFAPIDSTAARAVLQGLVSAGLADTRGERGGTEYVIRSDYLAPTTEQRPHIEFLTPQQPDQESLPLETDDGAQERDTTLSATAAPPSPVTGNTHIVWVALGDSPVTLEELIARTGLTESQTRYALKKLRNASLARLDGGQGRRDTTYSRLRSPEDQPSTGRRPASTR